MSYRGAEWQAHFYCFQAPCYVVASTMSEFNLLDILWERASAESADFAEEHLGKALVFSDKAQFMHFVIQKMRKLKVGSCFLSCNAQSEKNELDDFFTRIPHSDMHSFRSLADAWKSNHPVKDPYSNTTPPSDTYYVDSAFKQSPSKEIPFVGLIHIEGGIPEVAKIVLEGVEKNLKQGVLLMFGELIGYPNWRNGQYRAWNRIAEVYGLKFRYLGFCDHQALVEITGRDAPSTEVTED